MDYGEHTDVVSVWLPCDQSVKSDEVLRGKVGRMLPSVSWKHREMCVASVYAHTRNFVLLNAQVLVEPLSHL
eukprot:2321370-Pleurochrysis_carterae.AAC.1